MTERGRSKGAAPSAKRGKTASVTFSPYLIRRHREQLAKWMKANGLDPSDIPDDYPLRVEEGEGGTVIRYRAYVRTEDGSAQPDPDHSDEVLTEDRTVPCTVPAPDLDHPGTEART